MVFLWSQSINNWLVDGTERCSCMSWKNSLLYISVCNISHKICTQFCCAYIIVLIVAMVNSYGLFSQIFDWQPHCVTDFLLESCYLLHGSQRPSKVLEFECCLEKCLVFQSALKTGNFPWKVFENDFMVLKNIDTRNLFCLSVVFHIDVRKVTRFSDFVIKSSSLLIQWPVFFTVQITKSTFFCINFFITAYYNWSINCEYWN